MRVAHAQKSLTWFTVTAGRVYNARMAMEDALVLAEVFRASPPGIEGTLDAYARRRRPRVDHVRQGRRAVGETLGLPPDRRDLVLRERASKCCSPDNGR